MRWLLPDIEVSFIVLGIEEGREGNIWGGSLGRGSRARAMCWQCRACVGGVG